MLFSDRRGAGDGGKDFSLERLIDFALIKELLLRLERARLQNADEPAIGAIDAEDAQAGGGDAQVKEAGLNAEPRRVGQKADRKRVFERLLNFPLSQRALHFKWRVVPIKLHKTGLIVHQTPMQCRYIVYTHKLRFLSIGKNA